MITRPKRSPPTTTGYPLGGEYGTVVLNRREKLITVNLSIQFVTIERAERVYNRLMKAIGGLVND